MYETNSTLKYVLLNTTAHRTEVSSMRIGVPELLSERQNQCSLTDFGKVKGLIPNSIQSSGLWIGWMVETLYPTALGLQVSEMRQ